MYDQVKEEPLQMVLHQVSHLNMQHMMHLLEEYDLKPGQAGILFTLAHRGELSQRELAKVIGVTPPSITVALRKMEKQDFIIRKPDTKDQRITRIVISEKGRECVVHIKSVSKKMEELLFGGMTAEERILLRRLLLQVRNNLLEDTSLKYAKLCPHL